MMTMLIVSVLLVALYMGAAIWRTGELPESISSMVYLFRGGWRWLWSIWLWLVTITTFAPVMEILDGMDLGFLGFIPAVCLVLVGAWPLVDTEHRKWHYRFAVIGGILSQIPVVVISPWCLMTWSLMLVYILCGVFLSRFPDRIDGKGVLVSEVICYTGLVLAALCHAA